MLACRFSAPEGLRDGVDSVTQDFATNIYRMKELGFNAVRLPYRFSDLLATWTDIIEHECQVAPAVSPMPPCAVIPLPCATRHTVGQWLQLQPAYRMCAAILSSQ
jgi:hypothetical protein